MAFRVARRVADDSRVPDVLVADLPTWRRADAVRVRDFAFRAGRMHGGHGWLIDGLPFDPARTDVTTRLGDVEVWRLIADVHHPVHLHLVGFRVLSRGGRPAAARTTPGSRTPSPCGLARPSRSSPASTATAAATSFTATTPSTRTWA